MGRFDNILLCSDWDGTLCYGTTISEKDIKAIKYFQENGGLFTICSGRFLPYLEKFFDKVLPNTYVICLNGAIIINPHNQDIVFEGNLDFDSAKVIKTVLESDESFYSLTLYPVGCSDGTRYTREEFENSYAELSKKTLYKAIIISKNSKAVATAKSATTGYLDRYSIVSSWSESIEILSKHCTKGEAIKRLKALTGRDITVAIGDYENDISMLHQADISYAPSNAIESAKTAAVHVTLSPCGGAIAEVISDLESIFG